MFGGTAAYLQQGFGIWFGDTGHTVFATYTVLLLLISFACVFSIPETKAKDLRG